MNILFLTLISALIVCSHGWHWRYPQGRKKYEQEVKYQWKAMEFGFPSRQLRQQAEADGHLIPKNAMLIDVQPHYNNKTLLRTFVALPRFQDGIPYTLATITERKGNNGPLLKPYPNYKAHDNRKGTNCDAIISAFHMAISQCNQLWVIDDGSNGSGAQCPPKLLMFDLNTDKLILKYTFDESVYIPRASSLFNLVVDSRDPSGSRTCNNTMVYIADVNNHGLVVYNYKENRAWRVDNLYMYPDPKHGNQTVAGESFVLMDGIFGIATDKKNLYFHPFASLTEYSVPLKVLDNSTLFENNSSNMIEKFTPLGERQSACTGSAMDSNNNLYCVTLNPIELIKWNVNTPYDRYNIETLLIKRHELQFISGIKVARNSNGTEELWMVSSRYQKMRAGTRNFNETNFRVVVFPLATTQKKC